MKAVHLRRSPLQVEIDLEQNLARVRRLMAEAALRAGRDPREIALVAVTKSTPADSIWRAYQLGVLDFGESRVQEAEQKIPSLRGELKATWHMVGPLQRNKVKKAVELFDWIHSVESFALAQEISQRAAQAGKAVPILLEVNASGDPHKHGFAFPLNAPQEARARFFDEVARSLELTDLIIAGLMSMAPAAADPENSRPYFRHLKELRHELGTRFPQLGLRHLSMGMSDDFPVAIEEGATLVRIGRAIFGERREHD